MLVKCCITLAMTHAALMVSHCLSHFISSVALVSVSPIFIELAFPVIKVLIFEYCLGQKDVLLLVSAQGSQAFTKLKKKKRFIF